MQSLSNTSQIVAAELREAERSINLATRDTAQFLVTCLEGTEAHSLSAATTHRTVRATVAALAALVDGQNQMAMRAHLLIEKAGRELGLAETDWGENLPKPAMSPDEDISTRREEAFVISRG